jgi:branched-chain amino acid transport system ATP-binding protein
MTILRLEDVTAGYGVIEVLRGLRLEVRQGEIVAVIGPNGAGKSTLLRTISGLIRPRRGSISFGDRVITNTRPEQIVRLGICQVPEGRHVFAGLTVEENLRIGAYTQRDPERIAEDRARVFELFPILRERREQVAGTLSGGEQQMLVIGRALMSQPKLLMLDEPSMGLAPRLVRLIFERLGDIVRTGTSILLVEQNARMALRVADRGYVIEQGAIVIEDAADRLADMDSLRAVYLGGATQTG